MSKKASDRRSRKAAGPVSIADVARAAKVSMSTVSRVLNRPTVVNQTTRERVEQTIKRLGFQPNVFARGLMLRKSEIVGLLLPDLHGEFYSEIIRGATQQARASGYALVVSSARDHDESHSLLNMIQQRTVLDGIAVMVADLTNSIREALQNLRLPFVLLDHDIPGTPHDSVVIDQDFGTRQLVRHIVRECGASRVIFVGGPATNVDTMARFDAYRKIMAESDLAIAASDVFYLDYQYETALALATQHVRAWSGAGNCVFAANDEMAAAIVTAALSAGLRVPEDLAVVGFDDTRIARMTHPPLTTVRVPMAQMGAKAIELLCARASTPARPPTRVSLQPELVVRESCGAMQRARAMPRVTRRPAQGE